MVVFGKIGHSLIKNLVKRKTFEPLVQCRFYALKYVNPRKYDLEEVTVIQEDDPKSVKIIEKHGKGWHLLDESRNSSLAHTISGDFDCYYGLSRQLALKFPEIEKLKLQEHPLGSVTVLNNGPHFLYFLIIRENWWDRGAYRPMRESLKLMKDHALDNNVPNITMGRLGSHKDGLDFREIMKDMKNIFYDSGVTLTVYPRRT